MSLSAGFIFSFSKDSSSAILVLLHPFFFLHLLFPCSADVCCQVQGARVLSPRLADALCGSALLPAPYPVQRSLQRALPCPCFILDSSPVPRPQECWGLPRSYDLSRGRFPYLWWNVLNKSLLLEIVCGYNRKGFPSSEHHCNFCNCKLLSRRKFFSLCV